MDSNKRCLPLVGVEGMSSTLDNYTCLWGRDSVREATDWTYDLDEQRRRLQDYLDRHQGRAHFPALFTLEGDLVAARLVTTHNGTYWGVLTSDDPHSKVRCWFRESTAKRSGLARKHDAAHGYYVGCILANAKLETVGSTRSTWRVAIVRADHGFSRNVEVLDNGRTEGTSSYQRRLTVNGQGS